MLKYHNSLKTIKLEPSYCMRTDRWTDGRMDIRTYMMKQMVAFRNYYSLLMYSFITCGHRCSMWDPLATQQTPHI